MDGLIYLRGTITQNGNTLNFVYRHGHRKAIRGIIEKIKAGNLGVNYTETELELKTLDELEKAGLLEEFVG